MLGRMPWRVLSPRYRFVSFLVGRRVLQVAAGKAARRPGPARGIGPARRPFTIAARAPLDVKAPETAPAGGLAPSHSVINELFWLLIREALAALAQTLTVTRTVDLSGTSIGAGFRTVLRRLTYRDLSRSINSRDHRRHLRRASVSVHESPQGAVPAGGSFIVRVMISCNTACGAKSDGAGTSLQRRRGRTPASVRLDEDPARAPRFEDSPAVGDHGR